MQSINKSSNKLIVALDFSNISSAQNFVNQLGDSVTFYKVGLELMMSGDYFKLIDWLGQKNKKVFADLKLFDIAATVGKAVKNLSQYENIHFLTIHAASKEIMSEAALNKGKMKILAVTVLTNLDQNDLRDMGFDEKISVENLVLKRAELAQKCGVDGVIASGFEAKEIRKIVGKDFTIITPGIRLEAVSGDDQKRVVDARTAFESGADYIVVGRPISQAKDPRAVVEKFLGLV